MVSVASAGTVFGAVPVIMVSTGMPARARAVSAIMAICGIPPAVMWDSGPATSCGHMRLPGCNSASSRLVNMIP
jgi:hypothetical protein